MGSPEGMLKLLAVDDEEDITHLVKLYFSRKGYDVIVANTASEAIRALEENPDVDVVLLDIMLPDGNGVELLEHIRLYLPNAAIIMATGVNDLETVVRAMQNGADDYVVKPFRLGTLEEKIESAIHKRSMESLREGLSAEEAVKVLEDIRERSAILTFSFDDVDELNRFTDAIKDRKDVEIIDIRIGDRYEVSVKKGA